MFYMEEKTDETSNYAKDYNTKRGGKESGYRGDSLSNYSNQELVNETTIFSPVSVEESDYKGCRKYCKGELGHGGGFLFMGGGGKSGRQEYKACNRDCKAKGGAAALQDKETTEDMLNKLGGDDDSGTSPIVWLMVGVIILALVGGGYMLLKKKK